MSLRAKAVKPKGDYFKNIKNEYSFERGIHLDSLEEDVENFPTPYLNLNFMLSGNFFEGLQNHKFYQFGGKKSSFKSSLALICAKSVLGADPDASLIFYDYEGIATKDNFEKVDINPDQLYPPRKFTTIDELTHLVLTDTKNIIQSPKNENKQFIIVCDGVGMAGANSSIEKMLEQDAISKQPGEKGKALKVFSSAIFPIINHYKVVFIMVNHVYDTIGSFVSKQIFSGGESLYNISHVCLLMDKKNVSKERDKDTNTAEGSTFTMQTAKSRDIIENFKLDLDVRYDNGIAPFSGLFEMGINIAHCIKPKGGRSTYNHDKATECSLINTETGEILEYNGNPTFINKDVEHSTDFWRFVFKNTSFAKEIREKVSLKEKKLIDEKALDSWSLINEMNNK